MSGMPRKLGMIALGLGWSMALRTAGAADPAAADTSEWTCTRCPFPQGAENQVQLGAIEASGANATFGRYNGLDHGGAYVDAGASGQVRSADGVYADYDLERLGLAAREGYVEGGREGRYDLRISYDGQPTALYDGGVSPYRGLGGNLGLPAGWAAAGSTAGMTRLDADLAPLTLGYVRRTAALLGRYFASPEWTLFGEFRRQEKQGTGLTAASFLTEAVQLPQPIDFVTDSVEAGAAYGGARSSLRLSYTGSWFEDGGRLLRLRQPVSSDRAGLHHRTPRTAAGQQPPTDRRGRQHAVALAVHGPHLQRLARHRPAEPGVHAHQHAVRGSAGGVRARRQRASVPLCAAADLEAAGAPDSPRECGLRRPR